MNSIFFKNKKLQSNLINLNKISCLSEKSQTNKLFQINSFNFDIRNKKYRKRKELIFSFFTKKLKLNYWIIKSFLTG